MQNKLNFASLKKLAQTITRVAVLASFLKNNWTCITEGKSSHISELAEIHFSRDMYSITKGILQYLVYNFKNYFKYFKYTQYFLK